MIDKPDILNELKLSREIGAWTSRFTAMNYELAKGVSSHRLFSKHSHLKDDLIQDGVIHLIDVAKKFDVTQYDNYFGYATKSLFRLYMKICRADDKHNMNRDFYCDDQDAIDDLDFDYE